MKLGIRINITQVDDEIIHSLHEIYDVHEFNEKQYPTAFREYLKSIKEKAIKLASGDTT